MMNEMIAIHQKLMQAQKIALFTHITPDGDALGSLFSLTHYLKSVGKQADAYVCEKVPDRLMFMAEMYGGEYFVSPKDDVAYDLYVVVDCGDIKRLSCYSEMFLSGKNKICIDHHVSNDGFADLNLVMKDASSTGEILYRMFTENDVQPDSVMASMLYASIASDTGCFQFTNTTQDTHLFAAKLIDLGAEIHEINKKLFMTYSKSALRVRGYVMACTEYFYNGQVAVACISRKALDEMQATKEDTEGLTDVLKSIEGVEAGIIMKEVDDLTRVSIRTNRNIDAAKLAACFGGGGHVRAAGCTFTISMQDAKEKIVKALEEWI